jgi:hypothetical protein
MMTMGLEHPRNDVTTQTCYVHALRLWRWNLFKQVCEKLTAPFKVYSSIHSSTFSKSCASTIDTVVGTN